MARSKNGEGDPRRRATSTSGAEDGLFSDTSRADVSSILLLGRSLSYPSRRSDVGSFLHQLQPEFEAPSLS